MPTDPKDVRFHALDAESGDEDSVRLVRCMGADCAICIADADAARPEEEDGN